MRILVFISFLVFLGCNEDKKPLIPQENRVQSERPENPNINKYRIKGYGLLRLDHSVMDFAVYESPAFSAKTLANIRFTESEEVVSDSTGFYPLPLFFDSLYSYFQVIAESDGFHKVVLDELYSDEYWVAPNGAQRFINWPSFLLENKNLRPIENSFFYSAQDVNSEKVEGPKLSCYRAFQANANWIFFTKSDTCAELKTPQNIFLRWRDEDTRTADFDF